MPSDEIRCATCGGPIPVGSPVSWAVELATGKQWISHRFRTDCERYWEWAKSHPPKPEPELRNEHLCECGHKRIEHRKELDLVGNVKVLKACSKCICLEFMSPLYKE